MMRIRTFKKEPGSVLTYKNLYKYFKIENSVKKGGQQINFLTSFYAFPKKVKDHKLVDGAFLYNSTFLIFSKIEIFAFKI